MRALVIVIADLYLPPRGELPAPQSAGASWPGIETLVRFGARAALGADWRAWLLERLGHEDLLGVAPACIAAAASGTRPAGTCWIATPLHLSVGPARVQLEPGGVLQLNAAQQAELAAAFRDTFAPDGLALSPLPAGDFLLEAPGVAAVATTEPARCLGRELTELLPRGSEAAPLRRLLGEIEMWLHAQALNAARARCGEPPVSMLWPWGGAGRRLPAQPRAAREPWRALGSDAFLAGLWHLRGERPGELARAAAELTGAAPPAGAVWVLEAGSIVRRNGHGSFAEALARLDADFVVPALTALRRGALASVTLIANDWCTTLRRRSRLRFWRRPRAGLAGLT